MPRVALRSLALTAAAAALLALTACAGSPAAPSGSDEPAPADAGYVTPGKLTIATGEIAYFPYVIDDDPASGEGFEASVAYAVAEKLGFAKDDVEWVRTSFDAAIAPGPKNFDFNIQQYTITDERRQAVDFSSPYYEASQAAVAIKGGTADAVDSLADLGALQLGAMAGSTSALTIDEAVKPEKDALLYDSNEDAVAALKANQIDAIVLDLPTAYYATGVYIEDSFIIGELPVAGVPDEWGLLLPKDSALTAEVSAAVDALRADGTLEKITDQWLGSGQGVTKLK
ncbi:transporter substrate-binding domain-containing protein [Microbacterium sp. H1-D42]|uniref:ABC transporter substrate-binding protein n=1 Tax=Microbacterium sp. H1-D42 TaxID=2925844 RepID=UPI001F53CFD9|nr:transporter substrate-binding domain-containing protein [Microbacterium sp. H1-D42]UNK69997.1 transporter substrate-binding domain-containing protein [Microbacterium sp. H1-D42]